MKTKNKQGTEKRVKKYIKNFKSYCYKLIDWVFGKSKLVGNILLIIIVILFVIKIIFGITEPLNKIYNFINKSDDVVNEKVPTQPVLKDDDEEKDPILKRDYDQKYNNRCEGAEFDILGNAFLPVGGERFTVEEGENTVSVKETGGYQAVVRTPWGCKLPFIARIRVYPKEGPSLGLIFEYEDMFRILIGDGDRKTIKVQQNKWNIRGEWPDVPLDNDKLTNTIEDGEEVLVYVKSKVTNDEVLVEINIYHSKYQSVETFNAHFIPTGANFNQEESRRFRIGMNDSFYNGLGSIIRMDTFSIKETDW